MQTPFSNRPLQLLCIHSELMCQNDAIQDFVIKLRVAERFTKFRFEKLYRVAEIKFKKRYTKDYEWVHEICKN